MRDAEDFGDGASRAEVAAFPGVEADDDFVAGLGRGEESGARRVAHDDFARNTRIVRDNKPLEAVVAERTRELGEGALDDANDSARTPVVAIAIAARGVELDKDPVAVKRDMGVIRIDVQLLSGR